MSLKNMITRYEAQTKPYDSNKTLTHGIAMQQMLLKQKDIL